MAIKGVSKNAIPYVLEDDRSSPVSEQTVFHIRPKTGHDSNRTVQRYAAARNENRKGVVQINVNRLDAADQEEFLNVVTKVENYIFPEDHEFAIQENGGMVREIVEPEKLKEVARTLSADHLSEVLEVSNNMSRLNEGEKKSSKS